ncbi:MAG: DUF547 domain-containing protein [Candidatus Omnitrophica bacterium]|nr:DUF547 domain-containing protein [Candidatus Omnitrophota bacterium]
MSVLELFTHAGCVSQREGPTLIRQVLKRYPHILFRQVDLLRDRERANSLGVKMSPTLVLDDKIISVGIPDVKKLVALLRVKKKKIQSGKNGLQFSILLFAVLFPGTHAFSSTTFDHNYPEWSKLLSRYTQHGFVDYVSIKKSPDLLNDYFKSIETISQAEFRQWSKQEKIAFWINAYNVATIRLITEYYPLHKKAFWKAFAFPSNSIQQIPNVWDRPALEIFGETVSLNHIENEILRKEFKEPRIHFALVCASLSCPVLRNEPYRADKLDRQLNDQVSVFLTNPKKFRYNPDADTLYLSPIFKWFKKDFETVGGIISFSKAHLPKTISNDISEETKIEWLDYDWSLNEKG